MDNFYGVFSFFFFLRKKLWRLVKDVILLSFFPLCGRLFNAENEGGKGFLFLQGMYIVRW